MSKIKLTVAVMLLSAVLGAPTFAASPKTMSCPVCHMPMTKTKTAMMNVPVYSTKYKTVYYCCPGCAAGTKAAAYYKAHKHPMPV